MPGRSDCGDYRLAFFPMMASQKDEARSGLVSVSACEYARVRWRRVGSPVSTSIARHLSEWPRAPGPAGAGVSVTSGDSAYGPPPGGI